MYTFDFRTRTYLSLTFTLCTDKLVDFFYEVLRLPLHGFLSLLTYLYIFRVLLRACN